jgi:predicted PurR-regulated permease PerM
LIWPTTASGMRIKSNSSKTFYSLQLLQYVVFVSVLLYVGKNLFIPLSFALLISFILYPFCSWLERKGLNRITSILAGITLLLGLAVGAITLLVQQFAAFVKEWPTVKIKLEESLIELSYVLKNDYAISKEQQNALLDQFINRSSGDVMGMIKDALSTSAFWLVLLILIPVFAVLILYYRNLLANVLYRIFSNERRESIMKILLLTITTYYNFIKGMAVVYIIVGILNSAGLLLLGVPHAIFFGFMAAILTFIPYVGIMVGALLPIAMAWITFNSIWYALGVVGIFAFVQYLEANVIFPIAVSNRLNINALATLVAILVGGILWGVAGMILFVPFLAITKLIADHHPKMKTWSILLGKPPTLLNCKG